MLCANRAKILSEMRSLTSISNQIAGSIQNIANGVAKFEQSINMVGEMAGGAKEQIEELNSEIGQFKV